MLLAAMSLIVWCGAASLLGLRYHPARQVQPTTTVRVGVTMVTVGVRVTDRRGREVHGLKVQDFRLYEDDLPQTISFFSEEEQPVSLGILLDRSQSMGVSDKLQRAKVAAMYLEQASHPDNEFLYATFDDRAEVVVDFTANRERVESAILGTLPGGGTSFYDAILAVAGRFASATYPRQALAVITDGADQHSQHTLDDVIQGLQTSQAQLFLIGYFSEFESRLFRDSGEKITLIDGEPIDNPRFVFKRLAEETGAASFFPRSDEEFKQAAQAISRDLRHQYTLAYYPPRNSSREGSYRYIRVKVRGSGLKVRARLGYRRPAEP